MIPNVNCPPTEALLWHDAGQMHLAAVFLEPWVLLSVAD